MAEFIDQEARDMANAVSARIAAHEDVCAVRWGNVAQRMDEMKKAIEFQTRQIWGANAIVISALLGLIWWLGNHAFR
jgi:hypothetical protein